MSAVITSIGLICGPAPTAKMLSAGAGSVGVFRLPTDPLFYASLTLRNIVGGSRYRITRNDTGAELASGVAAGSGLVDVTISGVACYANPQLVDIVVRNASASPRYKPLNSQAEITKSGATAFIFQVSDE